MDTLRLAPISKRTHRAREQMRNNDNRLTRRGFLRQMAFAGAVTVGAGYLIGCKPDQSGSSSAGSGGGAGGEAASADICGDISGLTEAEIKTRNQLGYIEKTNMPEKYCANCSLYRPEQYDPNECGGCTVMKGPVMAQGYCTAWAAKPA